MNNSKVSNFRAWIISEKKFSYSNEWFSISPDFNYLQYAEHEYLCNNINASDKRKQHLEEQGIPIRDEFVLDEFTGFYDANGVPIYERDVVQYGENKATASWHIESGAWVLSFFILQNSTTPLYVLRDNCKIVGNIHEI